MAPTEESEGDAADDAGADGAEALLLEQDFVDLAEALESGVWQVDGDDQDLYACEGSVDEGPPGAVVVTSGRCDACAYLIHPLRGSRGAQVSRLRATILCESLDADSSGSFTIGLSYNEDMEESSLLSITLRRERELPGEDSGPDPSKPVELHLNGTTVSQNVGRLPVRLEFEAELRWATSEEGKRRVTLRHRLTPVTIGAPGCEEPGVLLEGLAEGASECSADFYTPGVQLGLAQLLYMRCTGTVKARPMRLRCDAVESETVE